MLAERQAKTGSRARDSGRMGHGGHRAWSLQLMFILKAPNVPPSRSCQPRKRMISALHFLHLNPTAKALGPLLLPLPSGWHQILLKVQSTLGVPRSSGRTQVCLPGPCEVMAGFKDTDLRATAGQCLGWGGGGPRGAQRAFLGWNCVMTPLGRCLRYPFILLLLEQKTGGTRQSYLFQPPDTPQIFF